MTEASRRTDADGWAEPITGFRAVGVLAVVAAHVFLSTRIFPWKGFVHLVSLVVPLFFVFSAFALYRPFVLAQYDGRPTERAGLFWWRRLLRIYPLYAFALTTYLLVLPSVRPDGGRIVDYLKLYLFGQIYDRSLTVFTGIPAAWFLCVIVAFYLIMPALAHMGRWLAHDPDGTSRTTRTAIERGHALLAIAMIVTGQVARHRLLQAAHPGASALPVANLDFFGFGILLALASLRLRDDIHLPRSIETVRNSPSIGVITFLTGALVLNEIAGTPGVITDPHESIPRYAVVSVMAVPLAIIMALGPPDRSFNRMLAWSGWRWPSALSLPVYLWHQLILGGFDHHVTSIGEFRIGSPFLTGMIALTATVAIGIAWSALWRRPVDLPVGRWPKPPSGMTAAFRSMGRSPVGAFMIVGVFAASLPLAMNWGDSPVTFRGGTEMVTVEDARPGDRIVVASHGSMTRTIGAPAAADPAEVITEGNVDDTGSLILRGLLPGRYSVEQRRDDQTVQVGEVRVTGIEEAPSPEWFRDRRLDEGLNWIETRDGTLLDAFVHLPGPVDDGPYPTVVELSAYRGTDPDKPQPATSMARRLGYATVSVNVRGSGCSGGAFELFGPATMADGHDVVETVAHQPWVAGGRVGVIGFSLGGMYALEAAASSPPSLASVAALAVHGDATELFHPGGLDNIGFTDEWLRGLATAAEPSGADWVRSRIDAGDDICANNQRLHGQATDVVGEYLEPGRDDEALRRASTTTWGTAIDVPTFLSIQMHDANVGPSLARGLDAFDDVPLLRVVLANGMHGDALAPQIASRLDRFLTIVLTDDAPRALDPTSFLADTDDEDLSDSYPVSALGDPVEEGEDVSHARSRYLATPRVESLIDSGWSTKPGVAASAGSIVSDHWPPTAARSELLHLGADGRIDSDEGVTFGEPREVILDPAVVSEAFSTDGSTLFTNVISMWRAPTPGRSTSWTGEPGTHDRLLVGNPVVDLWVDTGDRDAALQAVLTEVDPDGNETYLQAGWRHISKESDETGDGDPWRKIRVGLGPVGHVLRTGSRIRLHIGTPGDGQVPWRFDLPFDQPRNVLIAQDPEHRAILTIHRMDPPTDLQVDGGCGDLRAQPCRVAETQPST